jgi:putative chitinase
MTNITADQLQSICTTSYAKTACVQYVDPINTYAAQYGLDTKLRLAAFIAQVLQETMQFQFLYELGNAAYLAKYDAAPIAQQLGNTQPGDGALYKGRGFFMLTGRANYTRMATAMGIDLINHPEQLIQPGPAVESACVYWGWRNLSVPADAGNIDRVSTLINGGSNGLQARRDFYTALLGVLV